MNLLHVNKFWKKSFSYDLVEKKLLLELGLQEGSEVKSFNGDGDSTLEAVNKMIDGV